MAWSASDESAYTMSHHYKSVPKCDMHACMCIYIYASNIGQAIGRYFTVVKIMLVVYLIYPELQCRLQCSAVQEGTHKIQG